MHRRTFLSAASAAFAQPKRQPNILLILMDDLGWKDFSCYGSQYYQTPNIGALAKKSVRFDRFYAACPVCSPTRASILTGKYPTRTGITDYIPGLKAPAGSLLNTPQTKLQLDLNEKTIPEYLRPRGYTSASFGKWHLGGEGFSPTDQGFDLNIGGDHRGQPNRYLAPFNMPGLADAPEGTELTGHLTAKAIDWALKQQRANQPYFLYLPQFAVHTPLASLPALVEKYKSKPHVNPTYSAMMECVDNAVGALTSQLDLSNTITILTSDNGGIVNRSGTPITSNSPLREQKGYVYEGGIRVPCLISAPGLKPSVKDSPACSIDLLPTILSLLGQPAPMDIDGTPIFSRDHKTTFYWHYPHYHGLGGKPSGAIIEDDWKLVEHFETSSTELYNLEKDISEKSDLRAKDPKRAERMQTKLAAWRTATKAVMPQKA